MNKRLLIALTAIFVIIALTFAFVACNKDKNGDDPGPNPDPDKLSETAFFTAVREVENPKFDISIADADDTIIYSIDSNGVVYNPFDLEDCGSFVPSSTSLDYEHDLFATTSINGKVFTGEIRNPLEFLGIADDSVSVSNTKVTIELQGSENKLKNVKITSNAEIGSDGYKLTVTVLP